MKRVFCLFILLCSPLLGDDIAHRLKNCEIELDMMRNNLQSQEESRAQLYKEMEESSNSMKRVLKEIEASNSDPKQKVQKTVQGLQNDFTLLKQHTNQLSTKMNELAATVSNLKKEIDSHTASLKSIEEAIALLTKALDPQKEVSLKNGKYIVQPGDSLDKIAKKTGMSIKELKELNHLSSSVIRPGQELAIH